MNGSTRIMAVVAAALMSAGCLRHETTHTLYLSPDGELHWQVEESDVRSDEDDEVDRLAEQQRYILRALAGDHRAAQALQAIEPAGIVRTTVVREEAPYHVVTDARFSRIDHTLARLFAASGLEASVHLAVEGEVTRLRIRLDFTRSPELRETPVLFLLEALGDFRFVLTEGSFIAGGGFAVTDRRRASLSPESLEAINTAMESRKPIELVLAWTSTR